MGLSLLGGFTWLAGLLGSLFWLAFHALRRGDTRGTDSAGNRGTIRSLVANSSRDIDRNLLGGRGNVLSGQLARAPGADVSFAWRACTEWSKGLR